MHDGEPKITKVFAVTSGDYSSYSVNAVFSTREKAEKYINHIKKGSEYKDYILYSDYNIEEYNLDPVPDWVYRENRKMYMVQMHKDGKVRQVFTYDPAYAERWTFTDFSTWDKDKNSPCLCMNVWAKNKDHAVKIVNEKRAQLLANELWNVE